MHVLVHAICSNHSSRWCSGVIDAIEYYQEFSAFVARDNGDTNPNVCRLFVSYLRENVYLRVCTDRRTPKVCPLLRYVNEFGNESIRRYNKRLRGEEILDDDDDKDDKENETVRNILCSCIMYTSEEQEGNRCEDGDTMMISIIGANSLSACAS